MELKINKPTFPDVIEFNFDELKAEITEKSEMYANLIYTSDQITIAKKDVATLRKFTTAINDERKKVKKECLKPYEEFERKIKELESIVNTSISNIDGQIKAFDEQKKAEKLEKIKELWDKTSHPDWLTCKQIFDNKWLNVSTTLKKVEEAINERITQINSDIETLSKLAEFSFEAIEEYKISLDINRAIAEGQRVADIQRRKEEAAKAMAETEKLKAENALQEKEPTAAVDATPTQTVEAKKEWVSFKALLSVDDAKALNDFFNARNIEFKAI